jgi:cytochrome c oxidase subunit 4
MSTDHDHAAHADDGAVHAHISSTQFYCGILAALVFLTILTVKVSYYDFGSANIIIALLVATMKASLVAAFFMHLRHDSLFNTLAFLAAFLFLGIFILLTYDDLGRRARVDPAYGGVIEPRSGVAAPGGQPATSATQDSVEGEPPHGEAAEKGEKKE